VGRMKESMPARSAVEGLNRPDSLGSRGGGHPYAVATFPAASTATPRASRISQPPRSVRVSTSPAAGEGRHDRASSASRTTAELHRLA
jgi:hypothetical protein